MDAPSDATSPAHSKFDRVRAAIGFVLAPSLFTLILFSDLGELNPPAHRLAAIMAAVIVLWICESLPMPVTALLGAAACVLLDVAPAKEVFAPFADQLMFLFIGSFIIARAIFLHQLDRRVAYAVLSLKWVAARPSRLLFAFGAVTAFISAWISNTATTAMMFAIGLSLLKFLRDNEQAGGSRIDPRFATGLMLMTSFSASIGGLATPIGTPPNVMGLRSIRDDVHVEIPFLNWMFIGVPVVIVLYLILWAYLNLLCRAGVREIQGCRELLLRERKQLGPWTAGQRSTLIAFLTAVALWLLPGIAALVFGVGPGTIEVFGTRFSPYQELSRRLPDAIPAILAAGLLFILPGARGRRAITWHEAAQIDWGVVLLYGGGVALGMLSQNTGLAAAVAGELNSVLPLEEPLAVLAVACVIAVTVSELTSNTASAAIVVPTVIAAAKDLGVDPLAPAIGATLACSLGFMLPVSTPCNAIVYGSGLIPLGRMIRYGLLLDVVGVIVIVALVSVLAPWVRSGLF